MYYDLNVCCIVMGIGNCGKPTTGWYFVKRGFHGEDCVVGYCTEHADYTDRYGGPNYVRVTRAEAEVLEIHGS